MKPDQEPLLVEQIHAAAFKHNTLGLPKICPEENVGKISRQTLYTYLKAFHRQCWKSSLARTLHQSNSPDLREWLWLVLAWTMTHLLRRHKDILSSSDQSGRLKEELQMSRLIGR